MLFKNLSNEMGKHSQFSMQYDSSYAYACQIVIEIHIQTKYQMLIVPFNFLLFYRDVIFSYMYNVIICKMKALLQRICRLNINPSSSSVPINIGI